DGLHVERVTEHEGDVLSRTQIGEPVPGEDALDADDDVVAVRRDGAQQRLGAGGHVLVEHDVTAGVEDADVHDACMQIDSAVILVLLCVESHPRSPLFLPGGEVRCVVRPSYPAGYAGRRPG